VRSATIKSCSPQHFTEVCLAGGRNKLAADLAYEMLNNEIKLAGLKIVSPHTIRDVKKQAVVT
jgi:hypothetical protein